MVKIKIARALKLIVFPVIAALLFMSLSYMIRPNINGQKTRLMGFYAQPKNSLDMVYIGPSSVYRGWLSPYAFKNFGFTSYPLASAGQCPAMIKYLVKEALKYQHPKLFLIDLRSFKNNVDNCTEAQVRGTVDNMRYSWNRYEAVRAIDKIRQNNAAYRAKDNIMYYLFDLVKYKSLWNTVNPSAWCYAKDDPFKGYIFRDKEEVKKVKVDTTVSRMTKRMPIPDENKKVLLDLLDYCKSNKLQVLFTTVPYAVNSEERMLENDAKAIIKNYGYNGADIFDGNALFENMKLNPNTDFYNELHLGIQGAEKFTGYLGAYIQKKYQLPDRWDNTVKDNIFNNWESSYNTWLAQEEISKKSIENKLKPS